MPDRAIIPFTISVMGGFFIGLLCSVLQVQPGTVVVLAIVGAIAAAIAAVASVVGCEGEDKGSVAILRTFYAVLLFLGVDLALVSFLKDGRALAALLLLIGAGLAAGMLATPRVRAPEPERREGRGAGAQPTA